MVGPILGGSVEKATGRRGVCGGGTRWRAGHGLGGTDERAQHATLSRLPLAPLDVRGVEPDRGEPVTRVR